MPPTKNHLCRVKNTALYPVTLPSGALLHPGRMALVEKTNQVVAVAIRNGVLVELPKRKNDTSKED